MKRKLCLLLAAVMLLLGAVPAHAAATVQEVGPNPDWKNLTVDVAVSGDSNVTFYGSVDGSERVRLNEESLPSDQIGHIIVVDMGYTWTTYITQSSIQTAINAYLGTIPRGEKVKFILANESDFSPTAYMSVDSARSYVNSLTKPESGRRTGQPSATTIGNALNAAFAEAGSSAKANAPAFCSVFALVDLGNQNASGSYSNSNGSVSFPVTIAAIYNEPYMRRFDDSDAGKRITNNLSLYSSMAQNCGTTLIRLNCDENGAVNASSIAALKSSWSYFTVDLSPLHRYIDYGQKSHSFTIYTSDVKGRDQGMMVQGVDVGALPTSPVTPTPPSTATPTPSPTPTEAPTATPEPTPTPTPDPFRVHANDGGEDALKVIMALKRLYYLPESADAKTFDSNCQMAFMEFCAVNGQAEKANITHEAFELLLSDQAVPKATATPKPVDTPAPATPSPTVVPLIYNGCNHTRAKKLIKLMQELYYLEPGSWDAWDADCMLAFQTMCETNGIAYSEEYIDDEMYSWIIATTLAPWPTATPYVSPTPVPESTIPPEGYALYAKDDPGNAFIDGMQTVLQRLNLYEEPMTKGVIDLPTMNAIVRYCELYGLVNSNQQRVDYGVINDILTNGASRQPYVAPEAGAQEKVMTFLQRDALQLGGFAVKMWMLVVVVVLLIFLILVIVITNNHKSRNQDASSSVIGRRQNGNQPVTPYVGVTPNAPGWKNTSVGSDDQTVPVTAGGDDDMTLPAGSGINVTFSVTGGASSGNRTVLINQNNFVLGRPSASGASCDLPLAGDKTVSRKHAAISYQHGQLMIFNLSSNGTRVNGQNISETSIAPSDETVPLNAASSHANGQVLQRGDVIEIGNYRITVSW